MSEPTESTADALRAESQALRKWMLEHSLPLWAGPGMHASGASWEVLDFAGQPIKDDETRVRVQARQLFTFSLAHKAGWEPDRSRALVAGLFRVLDRGCRRDDGLFGKRYSLSRGVLTDSDFCLYDTAFAILAFAMARDLLDVERVDTAIAVTLQGLRAHRTHAGGGYVEDSPAPKWRLQNPHMHLFESLLALRQAGYETCDEQRPERLLNFVSTKFFDPPLGIVQERRPADRDAVTFEPGHSMEWVWLLSWYARLAGTSPDPFAAALYARALPTLDDAGMACMEASVTGPKTDATRRLWSQAEVLKAHMCMAAQAQADAREPLLQSALQCCRSIRRDWLAPAVRGGWIDHLDAAGKTIATNMPASTGYHLFGAIEELHHGVLALAR